jgi:hypothetical protein
MTFLKNNCQKDCGDSLGLLIIGLITFSFASYIIYGIVVSLEYEDLVKECKDESDLGPYVVISLIIVFTKCLSVCAFTEKETALYLGPFLIIIEIGFITWGLVEIFYRAKKCKGLMYSDLWIYAIVCNVIQMIYLIIITTATVLIIMPKRNKVNTEEV